MYSGQYGNKNNEFQNIKPSSLQRDFDPEKNPVILLIKNTLLVGGIELIEYFGVIYLQAGKHQQQVC